MNRLSARFITSGMLLAAVVIFSAPALASTSEWISFTPVTATQQDTTAGVVVQRADATGLDLTVDIPGLAISELETAAGQFILARWSDASQSGDYGCPALPVVRKLFIAPPGAVVTVDFGMDSPTTIDLAALGYEQPIAPVQPPSSKTEPVAFQYSADAYADSTPAPQQRISVTKLGIMRERHLYLLEVHPVAYTPALNTLTVWPRLEISLNFVGGDAMGDESRPMLPLSNVLLNPPRNELRGGQGNYLIIMPSDFAGSAPMTDFENFKIAQGYNVLTYTAAAGSSASDIKSYIQSLWGTGDAPDYILLVGDTDGTTATSNTIPHFLGNGTRSAPTDLPYTCMDGGSDWYPDIAIGRFPASTTTNLQTIVDKTQLVAGGVFDDAGYTSRASFCAGTDPDNGDVATHNWVIDTYLTPNDFTCDKLYTLLLNGDTEDLFESFNAGSLFIVYFGHSDYSSWWSPAFTTNDVYNLTNDGLYSFLYAYTCVTGNFTQPECIAEAWLRVPNKGGVSYVGSSALIYDTTGLWEETVTLEKATFTSIYDDNVRAIGPAWQNTITYLIAEYGASNPVCRDYSEMFNLMGDPSLHIPEPGGFSVSVDPAVQSICQPPDTEAVFTVQVEAVMGFSNPVALSVTGVPGYVTVDFSVNNAVPPFTTQLTLGNLTAGEYDVRINGNAGGATRFTNAGLIVSTDTPGFVSLVGPTGINVPLTPTLEWFEVSDAAEYYVQIATDAGFTDVVYSATTPETTHTVTTPLEEMTYYFWRAKAINGCGEGPFYNMLVFQTYEQPEYFTQVFDGTPCDLEWYSIELTPDGSGYFYEMCGSPVNGLPTDPAGGTNLPVGNDGYRQINPDADVLLYGTAYDSVYVNANGNLTFNGYDPTYNESLMIHLWVPRISGVFDDLAPNLGGTVSWKELADRVVVTYQDVRGYGFDETVTFQIEMFNDGAIHITWLDVDSESCVVGVSAGVGIPDDYEESDLSGAESCGPVCIGDLDEDGDRDIADLAELLGHYGDTGVTYYEGDLDEDGDVDIADLAELLGVYGDACP